MKDITYEFFKVAVPIAIILIELAIGFQLYNAINRKKDADEKSIDGVETKHRIMIFMWSIAGFALASVLPAIGLALMIASSKDKPMSASLGILAIAICLVSWMAHGYLVFSGEQTQIAKEFVVYKWQRRRIIIPLKRQYKSLEKQLSEVTILLNNYIALIKELTISYSAAIPKKVTFFLIKYFGYNPFGGSPTSGKPDSNDIQEEGNVVPNIQPKKPIHPRGEQHISTDNNDNESVDGKSNFRRESIYNDEGTNHIQPNIVANQDSKEENNGSIDSPESYLRQIIESQIRSNENKVKP